MSAALVFKCQCGAKLAPVPSMDVATQVVRRTCRRCRAVWSVVVRPLQVGADRRMDKAELLCLQGAR